MIAIASILKSEGDWEIEHLPHDQFQDGISTDQKYQVSFVDLMSLPYEPDEYIQDIREKKLSEYLVTLCEDDFCERNEALKEAGANKCFPIDSDTEDLLHIVSQLEDK